MSEAWWKVVFSQRRRQRGEKKERRTCCVISSFQRWSCPMVPVPRSHSSSSCWGLRNPRNMLADDARCSEPFQQINTIEDLFPAQPHNDQAARRFKPRKACRAIGSICLRSLLTINGSKHNDRSAYIILDRQRQRPRLALDKIRL